MFIELLRFRVGPEQTEAFLAHNRRWLATLQQRPGFLAQRTCRRDDEPDRWLVRVEWRDRAAMENFPGELQRELDAVGENVCMLEQAEHYWEAET